MNALQAMKMQLNVTHTENGDLALLIMMISEMMKWEFWTIIGRQNLSIYG